MPSKRMTGINRAERRGDSGAHSLCTLPRLFLLPLLTTPPCLPSTFVSSLVYPLHLLLSWTTVLLKPPRWPLYQHHWSAQGLLFSLKRPFSAVNRCARTRKTHFQEYTHGGLWGPFIVASVYRFVPSVFTFHRCHDALSQYVFPSQWDCVALLSSQHWMMWL